MANQIQDSILKSIDLLVQNRIDNIATDKTVTASVIRCTNSLKGEYKLSYNGGFMTAYSQNGATYNDNTTVYVLVPEGDFTKKKLIVDKAVLSEEDENITFVASALSDYNTIGRNTIIDNNDTLPIGLYSYLKEDYWLLYEYGQSGDEKSIFKFNDQNVVERGRISHNIDEFSSYVKNAEVLLIEASFKTRLPKLHRLSKTGNYGVQFNLAFKDGDATDENGNAKVKYYSYVVDMNNMVGNPYNFTNWNDQYVILPIDTENFLYVDSIMAFCQGFEQEDDRIKALDYGADILIKDLEIYGLKKITSINGGYRLTLGTPQGAIFKTIQDTESLDLTATTTYQVDQDLSDSTTYYWFAEDNRVTTDSEDYHMYGGSGWRHLKDKGVNRSIVLYGNENRAYENVYKCVAVYKESVILKEQVVFYNDFMKRDISISSNLGIKFSFDRGKPILTCLIDGKSENFEEGKVNPHKDEWFTFIWSKELAYGESLIFNRTVEELKEDYDKAYEVGSSYSMLVSLKNKIAAMEGVEFEVGKNELTYPTKLIDSTAIFKCNVYLKDSDAGEDYSIGSAEILLQNEMAATPEDYYITIENGEQMFQYSESGVSPANERYIDPLEIKPLVCHFFDPAGLEVNNKTYTVKWLIPLDDTLIVTPKEGMIENPSTQKKEWCILSICPMSIKENYDYAALDNQITCIVTYNGQEYTKDTRFFFGKVGDNGTNGTDIIAKISPTSELSILDNEMLTLELTDNIAQNWNTGQSVGDEVFSFDLYQRNEPVDLNSYSVSWSMSDKLDTYMGASNGIVTWDEQPESIEQRLQIVKATGVLERQSYYAYYPVPVVDYKSNIYGDGKQYHVSIVKDDTLKQILYNADGRNPQYNKNQGVHIEIRDSKSSGNPKFIVWTVEGGLGGNAPAIKLIRNKNDNKRNAQVQLSPALSVDENGNTSYEYLNQVYILPEDVYDGLYTNNLVHCKIYTGYSSYQQGYGNPEAEVYIPIHCSLNRFGLASLNAWDGNHVEINEEENYILAPQIGAGEKDENNAFTGVVMGKAATYGEKEPSVGLLGYSKGRQSIFLDSRTGKAVFGLPENQASENNLYQEGRVELVPNGISKIGMWNIGSRAIYNMTQPQRTKSEEKENGETVTYLLDDEGNYLLDESGNRITADDAINNNDYKAAEPLIPAFKGYRMESQYKVANATMSTPPQAQGIILSANPSYISVKGMPLTADNKTIEWDGANTVLKQGDSLEVEIDPAKNSIFSIYRHTKYKEGVQTENWQRYPLVGINSNGQFYTNAVESGESSMGIGKVGAFGYSAADDKFVGAMFAYSSSNLFKFFIDNPNADCNSKDYVNSTLYISTGTRANQYGLTPSGSQGGIERYGDEYARPIKIYGDGIYLFAKRNTIDGSDTWNESIHKLVINRHEAYLGHDYAETRSGITLTGSSIKLENPGDVTLNSYRHLMINAANGDTTLTTKNKTETINGNHSVTVNNGGNTLTAYNNISRTSNTGGITDSAGAAYSLTTYSGQNRGFTFNLWHDRAEIKSKATDVDNASLSTIQLDMNAAGISTIRMLNGIKMYAKNNGIDITTRNDSLTGGIRLRSKSASLYLSDDNAKKFQLIGGDSRATVYCDTVQDVYIQNNLHVDTSNDNESTGNIYIEKGFVRAKQFSLTENYKKEKFMKANGDEVTVSYETLNSLISYLFNQLDDTNRRLNTHINTEVTEEQDGKHNPHNIKNYTDKYLTKEKASDTYLTKNSASDTYLTKSSAKDTYTKKTTFNNHTHSYDKVLVSKIDVTSDNSRYVSSSKETFSGVSINIIKGLNFNNATESTKTTKPNS